MEFPTNLTKYLKVNQQGFVICSGKTLLKQVQPNFVNEGTKILHDIINQLGANSAKAQGLKQIITTAIKFNNSDHRLYLKVEGNKAIGFLRTGQKKLFYHDGVGKMRELNPTCVLDIYVHESYQRSGVGKEIFETFLQQQNKRPEKLAYDRPSAKLFGFLKKHYGLSKFIPQNNNFVIFDQYFTLVPQSSKTQSKKVQNNNNEVFNKTANRIYKYENNPLLIEQQNASKDVKQLNKTTTVVSGLKEVINVNVPVKKEQKIQDSLSLLEKEINRLHLKTPPVLSNTNQKLHAKEASNTINGIVGSKIDHTKINTYVNYAPWATTTDPVFRTTSNQYGAHYVKRN